MDFSVLFLLAYHKMLGPFFGIDLSRWVFFFGVNLSRWVHFLASTYPIGSIFWRQPIPLGPFFGVNLSRWVHFLASTYPVGSIFQLSMEPPRGKFGRVLPWPVPVSQIDIDI